jgi:hypothetical protein
MGDVLSSAVEHSVRLADECGHLASNPTPRREACSSSEPLNREGPDIAFSVASAVPALCSVRGRMGLIEHLCASGNRSGVVLIWVVHAYVCPAMPDVRAVQHLGAIRLCDGDPSLPANLGCVVIDPNHRKRRGVPALIASYRGT